MTTHYTRDSSSDMVLSECLRPPPPACSIHHRPWQHDPGVMSIFDWRLVTHNVAGNYVVSEDMENTAGERDSEWLRDWACFSMGRGLSTSTGAICQKKITPLFPCNR